MPYCKEALQRAQAKLEAGRLEVGDEISDTHYGVQSVEGVCQVIAHIRVPYVSSAHDCVRAALASRCAGAGQPRATFGYTNKMLVVHTIHGHTVIGFYSYDNCTVGIVVLEFCANVSPPPQKES